MVCLLSHSSRFAHLNLCTAVLDQVRDGWEFVIDPNVMALILSSAVQRLFVPQFNNVDLALQLLDKSSLGKDMVSFRRTKQLLSKALKGSVDSMFISIHFPSQ